MTWLDVLLLATLGGYVVYLIFGRKKSGCCGDCGHCSGCTGIKK